MDLVADVSETACWVALHRALESERPDALFHDPYARALAGERGAQIESSVPRGTTAHFTTAVRTCLFDELILRVIEQGEIGRAHV